MTRTIPSFAEEGLKRFLHKLRRDVDDLMRRGDWRFDAEFSELGDDGTSGVISTSSSAELAETTRPVSVAVPAPADLSAGDVLFALILSIEPTVTSPSGWVREAINSGTGDYRFVLDWKIAASGDVGSTFTWTVDGGTGETEVMVEIVAVSGVGATPIAGVVAFDGGSSVASVTPSASIGTGATAVLTLAASSETLPAAAADHSISGVTRAALTAADSSNLHLTLSAFLDQTADASPTVAFGTTAAEGGAYAIPIGFGGDGLEVRKTGVTVGSRPALNLIEGANVTLTVTDDSTNGEVDVTVSVPTAGSANLLYVRDEKASGTNGGASNTATWHTRDLNTIVTNELGATVSSNVITLIAGTYEIEATAPAFAVGRSRLRLWDVDSGAAITYGQTNYINTGDGGFVHLRGRFTLAAETDVRLDQYTELAVTSPARGLGIAAALTGIVEVYAGVMIRQVS